MNSKGYTEGLARDTARGIHIPSWVFPIRLEFYLKTAGQEFVFFSCSVHSCPAVFHSCPAVFILVLQSFNRIGLPLTIFSLFFSVFVIILDICGIHLHHFSKSCFNSFFLLQPKSKFAVGRLILWGKQLNWWKRGGVFLCYSLYFIFGEWQIWEAVLFRFFESRGGFKHYSAMTVLCIILHWSGLYCTAISVQMSLYG